MVDISRGASFQVVSLGLLRVVAGLLFWQHGARKLFGWLGAEGTVDLFSLMGLAGMLEFFGGILIVLGLFTRPVAFVVAGEMAVAYFMAHQPRGLMPIQNGGELPALLCFVFLLLWTHGPGGFSLDGLRSGATAGAPGEEGGVAAAGS